jgi:NAD(P)-dependent dehydrogenase (short-subunit alcohol dehydrogenase family)
MNATNPFSLDSKVAIVTGGTGVLGSAMAKGLAAAGAKVGILGRRVEQAVQVVAEIEAAEGSAIALVADVLEKDSLTVARDDAMSHWGRIDILVNAAGGNVPGATVHGELTFFKLAKDTFEDVVELNLTGSLLPCQVFGEVMAAQKTGSIINISSIAAQKPLTRVGGYGHAKAAIDNFTKWLAVEMAHNVGPELRVNAIAPGFFIGEQNRDLLLLNDGTLSSRGKQIIDHTPQRRFGEPTELVGTMVWLASDAARFVTGVVVPVDGGFSAFSGI